MPPPRRVSSDRGVDIPACGTSTIRCRPVRALKNCALPPHPILAASRSFPGLALSLLLLLSSVYRRRSSFSSSRSAPQGLFFRPNHAAQFLGILEGALKEGKYKKAA